MWESPAVRKFIEDLSLVCATIFANRNVCEPRNGYQRDEQKIAGLPVESAANDIIMQ
jgi:hypothetical protein